MSAAHYSHPLNVFTQHQRLAYTFRFDLQGETVDMIFEETEDWVLAQQLADDRDWMGVYRLWVDQMGELVQQGYRYIEVDIDQVSRLYRRSPEQVRADIEQGADE